jgi:hypothetical protein
LRKNSICQFTIRFNSCNNLTAIPGKGWRFFLGMSIFT